MGVDGISLSPCGDVWVHGGNFEDRICIIGEGAAKFLWPVTPSIKHAFFFFETHTCTARDTTEQKKDKRKLVILYIQKNKEISVRKC